MEIWFENVNYIGMNSPVTVKQFMAAARVSEETARYSLHCYEKWGYVQHQGKFWYITDKGIQALAAATC